MMRRIMIVLTAIVMIGASGAAGQSNGCDTLKGSSLRDEGVRLYQEGNYDEALLFLSCALQFEPGSAFTVRLHRGDIFNDRGDTELALTEYARVLKYQPSDAWVLYRIVNIYTQRGDYERALAELDAALAQWPQAETYARRGDLHWAMEEYELALADYSTGYDLNNDDLTLLLREAAAHRQLGDSGAFMEDMLAAAKQVDVHEGGADAYKFRSRIYADMGRYHDALADVNTAIDLSQDASADLYWSRANIFYHMGRLQLALRDHARAVKLRPDASWTYFHRGQAYTRLHRYDEALADFRQTLELDPDSILAHYLVGYIDFRRGDYFEAYLNYARSGFMRQWNMSPDELFRMQRLALE